jgi:site-specific DNA recombinase
MFAGTGKRGDSGQNCRKRGAYWRASTINGHNQRRTGILQCELYCGHIIWNRAYRVRHPDTKQRVWRYRPETEWQRSEAPHLRILGDDIFEAAQKRRIARAGMTRPRQQPIKRLLSGLLRCGTCEAGSRKGTSITAERGLFAHA